MTEEGSYIERLITSADNTNSLACMGLDPVPEAIPEGNGGFFTRMEQYYTNIFNRLEQEGVYPSAFKPNEGYFAVLDSPRKKDFSGSLFLASLIDHLNLRFPGTPVIFDAKRGDIKKSSRNYAQEIFEGWQADATTVHPYMGTDSVSPFLEYTKNGKGVYVLVRTSNAGAKDFQSLLVHKGNRRLYQRVGANVVEWSQQYPGTGAVVGATGELELEELMEHTFKGTRIPILIPGVGSQGGSARRVINIIQNPKWAYDIRQVRISSSSGVTHPWVKAKQPIPKDYDVVVAKNLRKLNEEIGYKPAT